MEMEQIKEKEVDKLNVPEALLEEAIKQDSLVGKYTRDIAQAKDEMRRIKAVAPVPENVPAYRDGPKRIEELEKKLKARREEVAPQLIAEVKAKFQKDAKAKRLEAQDKINLLEKLDQTLQHEIKVKNEQSQDFGKKTNSLEWLRDEIAQVDEMTKRIGGQMATLEIEIQAPSRVKVLDEAVVSRPSDKKVMMCGAGGFGAFAAIVLGISFLEFRKRKVSDGSEIAHGLNINLIGTLPRYTKKSSDGFYEAVESARTMLLHSPAFENSQVVMVTSAVGGEGKTFLSGHLSVSLARSGCRTLLIDFDLRRSSICKLFDLKSESGLSEVLRGEAEVSTVIQKGPVDGLSILPAGQSDVRAVQALNNAELVGGLFTLLRGQLSVIRSVSHLNLVYEAYERLSALRCRILGAVVHGVSGGKYGSSYRYRPQGDVATVESKG
jgi:hypothetical protein